MDSSFDLFETSSAEDEEEVEEDESILDLEPISEAEQSSFCVEMMHATQHAKTTMIPT